MWDHPKDPNLDLDTDSYLSLSLSWTENELTDKKPPNPLPHFINVSTHNSRNLLCAPQNYSLNPTKLSSPTSSRDLFNFTQSEAPSHSLPHNLLSPPSPKKAEESEEQLTPEDIEEYHYLKQKQREVEMRLMEIERKKMKSQQTIDREEQKETRLNELSWRYRGGIDWQTEQDNDFWLNLCTLGYDEQEQNMTDRFIGKGIEFSKIEQETEIKSPMVENDIFDHSLYEEKNKDESQVLNKSRRGLLFEQNKENIFIGNLVINDNINNKKPSVDFEQFSNRKLLMESNSGKKESLRYSNFEEREQSTISKFISNVDFKYTTNDSDIKRRKVISDNAYIEDYDEWKKIINFSYSKETPNISCASNLKSYGKYDSTSRWKGRKFIRHTREGSLADSEGIPVKEVNVYDMSEYDSARISNLKSFWEPKHNSDDVVVEYENVEGTHLEMSPIELQPSIRHDQSQDKSESLEDNEDNMSEMSSDIKDSSMMDIFKGSIFHDKDAVRQKQLSILEIDATKSNPSIVETSKLKSFKEPTPKKASLSKNWNRAYIDQTSDLSSKFNSHTIQWKPNTEI
jgi:hypothetical protein